MFSPLAFIALFYWTSCLAHNIFTLYYNYRKSLDKRIKLYKYLGVILCVSFYLVILFNMNFSNVGINTKGYTFLVYNHNFIVFFFLLGICFIFYCSHKLLFILKKKNSNDFLTLSEEDMRDTTIRQLINSLITRHLYFIFFFIFTYFPLCIMMLIKECLGVNIFDTGGGY